MFRFRFRIAETVRSAAACVFLVVIVSVALLATAPSAVAQSPGQVAAAKVRQKVLEQRLAERGIDIGRSSQSVRYRGRSNDIRYRGRSNEIRYRSHRPTTYIYGYPTYNYGSVPGYNYGTYYPSYPSYQTPYNAYGYPYGVTTYRLRTTRTNRVPGPRANTSGSNYFGSPHASQYFGN